MEKMLLNIQRVDLNSGKSLVLKNYLEKPYIWTEVYTKEQQEETYVGFYGNSQDKKMKEYVKFNENYIVFCFINPYVKNAEFIKKIYDINSKECLGYTEYPEFKKTQDKTLRRVK